MKTKIKKTDWIYFDVDDTLVMWHQPEGYSLEDAEYIQDPYIEGERGIHKLFPHKKHIELLKMFAARGTNVVVWSAGGYEWAKAVVDHLKINKYVVAVLEKPATYYDDDTPDVWLGKTPRWSKP